MSMKEAVPVLQQFPFIMSGIILSLIRAHTSRIPGLLSTRPYAALLRPNVSHRRAYAVKTEADIKIEEIQEL